ncbi:MAG: MFS transporter, partial [Chthoniobacterales bacterium]
MPSLRRNLPLFVAFRVLFHARFYYPVIGVLFLDLGLTLEQYALLNVIWAVVIIVLEIPSGALADVIGRKRVVVLAAVLMVAEMAVFAFAPRGMWMFWLRVLNRILSGAAAACAR